MYFLRWLTGHPAILITLITGVYALVNWSNLYHWFGDENPAVEMTHEAPSGDAASVSNNQGMSGMSGMQGMDGMSGKTVMQGKEGISKKARKEEA